MTVRAAAAAARARGNEREMNGVSESKQRKINGREGEGRNHLGWRKGGRGRERGGMEGRGPGVRRRREVKLRRVRLREG